jgi:hypothetical protein
VAQPCDVLCVASANGGRKISWSLKLLCLKRNIEDLSAIQEKSGISLGKGGNERFVRNAEAIRESFSPLSRGRIAKGLSDYFLFADQPGAMRPPLRSVYRCI